MPATGDDFEHDLVHGARRASELSIAWTLAASTAAIAIGIISSSAALVAFGAVGFVDMIGSVALVHHFRHGLRNQALSDRFEQRAHRIVTIGLLIVGVVAAVSSAVRLATATHASAGEAGLVIAGASVVVLGALAIWKVSLGARIPSGALRSDGHLSAIGATEGMVVLLGTAAGEFLAWHWADNVAALVVGVAATVLAIVTWRQIA